MQGLAHTGKENIDISDMIVPRVGLMQAINPEVIAGKVESGNFFHSVSEEDLGPEIDLVVLHHSKRYTLWRPRHDGGGVLARASDGLNWDQPGTFEIVPYKDRPKKKVILETGARVGRDIGLGKWGSLDPENPDSAPAATLSHVLVCADLNRLEQGPFVVFLQRSAEPVARMLLSKIQLDPAPMFGQIYSMSSRVAPSPSGDYNQYVFVKNGHIMDEELFKDFEQKNEIYRNSGVKTNDADEQDNLETSGDAKKGAAKDDSKDDRY